MPQITLYLSDVEYQRIQELAQQEHITPEAWVMTAVRRQLTATNPLGDLVGLMNHAQDALYPAPKEQPTPLSPRHHLPENQVFIDATAWIALIHDRPEDAAMRETYLRLVGRGARLCTTDVTLSEVLQTVSREAGRQASRIIKTALERFQRSRGMAYLDIIYLDETLWQQAQTLWLNRYRDGAWLDVVTLAAMQRRGIRTILTINRWFNQPGLRILPSQA